MLLKSAFERNFYVMQLTLVKIKWQIKWKYIIQKFHDICHSYYFKGTLSAKIVNFCYPKKLSDIIDVLIKRVSVTYKCYEMYANRGKKVQLLVFWDHQEMDAILLIIGIVYEVCRIVIKSVQQCTYFLFSVNLLLVGVNYGQRTMQVCS